MRYFYACIEQLDLALEQLKRREPSYARFALMLTDNIVELMLHTQCQTEIQLHSRPLYGEAPKYDRDTRKQVLGQRFDEKNRFCLKIGKIDQDEFEMVGICHSYRNELYHTGLKYDDIIFGLASHYHQLACELFRRFRRLGHGWYSGDIISEVVRKHAGDDVGTLSLDADGIANAASASLSAARPELEESLAETLATFAESKIEDVDGALKFLVSDNPNRLTESEIIENIQFHDHTHNEDSSGRIDFSKVESVSDLQAEMKRIRGTWSPPHSSNPVPGWSDRVPGIRQEQSPIGALRRFENLRRDMAYFERVVGEAALELDTWIQSEIDSIRGK